MSTIKIRRGTSAQWAAANPVLAQGEPGYDTATRILKVGDGSTPWADLVGFLDEEALSATIVDVGGDVFAPTDIASSAFSALRSKLDLDAEDVVIGVAGDSTGAYVDGSNPRWVRKFAGYLAALYPTKTITFRQWNVGTNDYDSTVTVQTGSGSRTVAIYNGSASGQNTLYTQTYIPTMLPAECDLVFVNHGHNLVGTEDTEAAQRFYSLGRDLLRYVAPKGALVYLSQNPRTDGSATAHRTRMVRLAEVCSSERWGFVNLTQKFLDTPGYASLIADGIHPTDAGSTLTADYLWALFTNPRIKFAAPAGGSTASSRLWVSATQFYPTVTSGGFPAQEPLAAWPTMQFGNAAATIQASASIEVPYSWRLVNVWLYWTVHVAGTPANVVWEWTYGNSARIGAELTSGTATNPLNNTRTPSAAVVATTPPNNYGEVHTSLARNQPLAPSNVRDTSRIVRIDIRRIAASASDTWGDDANMLGVLIERAL